MEFKPIMLDELMRKVEKEERLSVLKASKGGPGVSRLEWHGWRLIGPVQNLSLEYQAYPADRYPVILNGIKSHRELLETLVHVTEKGWCEGVPAAGYVRALTDVFNVYQEIPSLSKGKELYERYRRILTSHGRR